MQCAQLTLPPLPQAPLTREELADARRQLKATAKPFPSDFKWVSPTPLSDEHWATLGARPASGGAAPTGTRGTAAAAAAAAAAPADSGTTVTTGTTPAGGGSRKRPSGVRSAGGGGSSGRPGRKGAPRPAVAPYRLPLGGAAQRSGAGGSGSGSGGSGGGGGRRGYALRAQRPKRRRDSGYVSFDSDEDTEEEDIVLDDDDDETEDVELQARALLRWLAGPDWRGWVRANPRAKQHWLGASSAACLGHAARAAVHWLAASLRLLAPLLASLLWAAGLA